MKYSEIVHIDQLMKSNGDPKSIKGFKALYSNRKGEGFLGTWVSDDELYMITCWAHTGELRLVPWKQDEREKYDGKYLNTDGDLETLLATYKHIKKLNNDNRSKD